MGPLYIGAGGAVCIYCGAGWAAGQGEQLLRVQPHLLLPQPHLHAGLPGRGQPRHSLHQFHSIYCGMVWVVCLVDWCVDLLSVFRLTVLAGARLLANLTGRVVPVWVVQGLPADTSLTLAVTATNSR